VSARRRRTGRDERRRSFGQNFLADPGVAERLVARSGVGAGHLVVDIGAGSGALTWLLADTGAEVWAIEPDPVWGPRLRAAVRERGLDDRVRVLPKPVADVRLPGAPYRVVANIPFGLTTAILAQLLDDPRRGPERADLVVQRDVARRHATTPPDALRTAAWAPWWTFRTGPTIPAAAFRPRPSVDAAVLTIERRDPPLLPASLAPGFVEVLRPAWSSAFDPRRGEPRVRGSRR
jgi:23S rRNA (adenine-N6)-dimethyltransferase